MRTIGAVTVARSDYGIYLPIFRRIQADPDLRLYLLVSGMHLAPEFGLTVQMVEADGFDIGDRVEMLLASDTPEAIAKSMGLGVIGFAQAFARCRPDILLVLGDRFDMYAAAVAALPFKIPVAHIHGGEVTEGAIDEALRHSLTKLSHLHFTATEGYARRVRQLGEESWRVTVSGAPSLDNLRSMRLLSRTELEAQFGLRLAEAPLLVTWHPATLAYEQVELQTRELLAALDTCGRPVVFTLPNADTGGRVIVQLTDDYVRTHPSAQQVDTLGTQGYFSLMTLAAAMVGNSSSGIIEAASFELPVVNVGDRQKGRTRAANVLDVDPTRDAIADGIRRALAPEFRATLRGLANPYAPHASAAEVIAEALKRTPLDARLIAKHFCDTTGCE